jgi:hypothetical protein
VQTVIQNRVPVKTGDSGAFSAATARSNIPNWDFRADFALEELRHAAISSPADPRFSHVAVREEQGMRPGGFGLLVAKQQVDDLIYNEKGNDVLLIKYINPASQTVQG